MRGAAAVVIVEDNPMDVELALAAIQRYPVPTSPVVARDGGAALDLLLPAPGDSAPRTNPALVLLDLNLTDVSGLDILRKLRGDERTRMLPIVILTGSRDADDIMASYLGGANSYVFKPGELSKLGDVMAQILQYWLRHNEAPLTPPN